MAKKGNLVTGTAPAMPARPSSKGSKGKAKARVNIEQADDGSLIVEVYRDNSGPEYTPPTKHTYPSFAEAGPAIAKVFGGKR